MKCLLILLNMIIFCGMAFGQTRIDITIHARVDTSKQDVREIITLWTNYLSSKPDSIRDNPYWNTAEKEKYTDFDLTRASLYPFPSAQLLNYYKPTILSIEKDGEAYAIRTLFNAEGLEDNYKKSNPWCITKIYAVRENNQWKLKNALPIITKNWTRRTAGKITFIYPTQHQFNEDLAQKANRFCDSITSTFSLAGWKPFDYYITTSGDELGQLLGFDFFFTGYTTGKGLNDHRILLSSFDSEWYPHEFVHMIVENGERHQMINEGFATWLGGAMEKTFEERAVILAQQLSISKDITFKDVLVKNWGRQFAAFYTTGAILCKSVYDRGGQPALKTLLETPPDDEKLIQSVCQLLKIKPAELDAYWRSEFSKYLGK